MTQLANPFRHYAEHRDAEAFAQIVEQYQQFVFATCRRRLRNLDDVDDAVQETFLRLAKKATEIHENTGGWLHRCAVNVTIDIVRKRGTQARHETARAVEIAAQPADLQHELAELREHLDAALEKLDAADREIIIQRFFVGRKQNDLAADAGVAPSTISHRLERAVEQLRLHLKAMGCVAITAGTVGALSSLLDAQAASASVPAGLTANLMKIGLSGPPAGGATTALVTLSLAKLVAALAAVIVVSAGAWFIVAQLSSSSKQSTTGPTTMPSTIPIVPAATQPAAMTVVAVGIDQTPAPMVWTTTRASNVAGVLSGRVLDHDGKPIAGAVVSLMPGPDSATSDSNGNYVFKTVRASGEFRVGVLADGYVPTDQYRRDSPAVQLSADSKAQRDIVMDRGVSVIVTVTDDTGQIVPKAQIDAGMRVSDRYEGPQRTVANDSGQAHFTLSPSKNAYVIAAIADKYALGHATVKAEAPDKPLDVSIVLTPGVSVLGTAICSDGKPATGWKIVAKPDWWISNYYPPAVPIDKDGNFTLPAVVPGQYSISIEKESSRYQLASLMLPTEKQPFRLDIPEPSPASHVKFVGRVRFTGNIDRAEIPSVWVQAQSLTDEHGFYGARIELPASKRTGPKLPKNEAQFTFESLPPGDYRLSFESTAIESKTIDKVHLPGDLPVVELNAAGKSHLAGTVTDAATSRPITHFAVRVRKMETLGNGPNYSQDGGWTQVSNNDGRFNLELVGPGVYQAQVSAEGYAWQWSEQARVEKSGGAATVNFSLTAGGTLTGSVVDSVGKPVAGAKVIPLSMAKAVLMTYQTERFEGEAGAVTTDAQGHFTLFHLPAGTETLKIVHPDYAPKVVSQLVVVQDRVADVGAITMTIGGTVEGTTYDAQGQPAPNVALQFQDENGYGGSDAETAGRIASVSSDDNGHYRVEHLPQQTMYIHVDNEWECLGVVHRTIHPVDGKTAHVDFGGSVPIKGRLLSGGKPLGNRRVLLTTGQRSFGMVTVRGTTDADGLFSFFGPPIGQYELSCETDSSGTNWAPLRMLNVTGEPQDLGDITLDVGNVSIEFTAADAADLAKISFAAIETSDISRYPEIIARVNPAATTQQIANIPAGKSWLVVVMDRVTGEGLRIEFERRPGAADTHVKMHLPRYTAKLSVDIASGNIAFRGETTGVGFIAASAIKSVERAVPPDTYDALDRFTDRPRSDVTPIVVKDGETRHVSLNVSNAELTADTRICVWSAEGVLVNSDKIWLVSDGGAVIQPRRFVGLGSDFQAPPGKYHVHIDGLASGPATQDIEIPARFQSPIDVILQ